MKTLILSLSLAFGSLAFAQVPPTPSLVQLWSDKATYSAGQQAALMGQVNVAPVSTDYQYHYDATLNGFPIQIVSISSKEFAAISPTLTASPSLDFVVNVSLENVAIANNLTGSISFFTTDLQNLYAQLQVTTDPAEVTSLNQQIARDKTLIADLQQQQLNNRSALGSQELIVTASPAPAPSTATPSMTVTPTVVTGYAVGATVPLIATVTKTYTGEDGNQENVVLISQSNSTTPNYLLVTSASATKFTATSNALVSGANNFSFRLFTRSIAQANLLRTTITTAQTQRTALINQESTTNDPDTTARLLDQVNDLSLMITAYYQQLQNALIDQGAVSLTLNAQ